jgi:peptide/nickel transport system permease protein
MTTPPDQLESAAPAPATITAPQWIARLDELRRNPLGMVGAVILLLTVVCAVLGPLVWRIEYSAQDFGRLLAPGGGTPMGTDQLGRDVLSRVIHGSQVSLQVGAVSVAIALAGGLIIGISSAYFGGVLDLLLMRLTDIMFAVPGLVLAILIAGLLGPSRTNAMIAIGIVYVPAFARVIRGSSLSVMALPFVEAARALGVSHLGIMTRHVLRNVLGPVIVLCTIYLSSAILTEAALSFLGLGTQPPEPSWGSMLKDSMAYMQIAPWLAVFPGLAIMVVVLGLNFLGDGLRDVLDPRMRDAN